MIPNSTFRFGRDDRQEIHTLLKLLAPRKRVEWLEWCCSQVSKGAVKTCVTQTDGTVDGVLNDMLLLVFQHGLTFEKAGTKLVAMVRGK